MAPEGYMTLKEAGGVLSTDYKLVRVRINQGLLRSVKESGRCYVLKKDVERLAHFTLTTRIVAQRFGMHETSLRKWVAMSGVLPVLMAGKRRYFSEDDVADLEKKLKQYVSVTRATMEYGVPRSEIIEALDAGAISYIGFGRRQCCFILRKDAERLES